MREGRGVDGPRNARARRSRRSRTEGRPCGCTLSAAAHYCTGPYICFTLALELVQMLRECNLSQNTVWESLKNAIDR